jgi:hypothetical protein
MTAEQALEACQFFRESGASSRVPVPIVSLEKLCRDAMAWQSAPQVFKDAVTRGEQ